MAPLVYHVLKILVRNKRKKARKTVVYRKANRHRERGWVSDAMDTTLSDIEFTKMFRLSREAFNDLLEKISNVMPERNESQPLY